MKLRFRVFIYSPVSKPKNESFMFKKIQKAVLKNRKRRREECVTPFPAAGSTVEITDDAPPPPKKPKKRRCAVCKKVNLFVKFSGFYLIKLM